MFSCKKDNTSDIVCKDADGNVYKTVKIGNQMWMAENLKTTHYNNGDRIDTTTSVNLNYSIESSPKYQWPAGGDKVNVPIYGRLYTWFAATDSRSICPTGWHLPSQQEWETIVNYLGGYTVAGGKMKEIGTIHWTTPNNGADNSSGFTALPSGNHVQYGFFNTIGETCCWWSSTEWDNVNIFTPYLNYDSGEIHLLNFDRNGGFSIRCIKD